MLKSGFAPDARVNPRAESSSSTAFMITGPYWRLTGSDFDWA